MKKIILQFFLVLFILILGFLGFRLLSSMQKEPPREKAKITIPYVRIKEVEKCLQHVRIYGEGTVSALNQISLVPQVSGEAVFVDENLVNGGRLKKGQVLIRIEPEDYRLALDRAESKVKEARKQLALTREESKAAIREWQLAHPESNKKPPPLVARIPQLKAAEASLKAAEADQKEGLLNLERTVIRAPFPAIVAEENIDQGQYIAQGQQVGTIFSTKAVEIAIPLDDNDLAWLDIPGFTVSDDQPGSLAKIKARLAGQDMDWSGRIVRTEGRIDPQTRLVKVVVRVENPYSRKPPLAVGLFTEVEFVGRKVEQACSILESALHNGNTVWIVDEDNKLRFRQVEVLYRDGDNVLIESGLDNGDRYVVSKLKTVSQGMKVRIQEEKQK